MTTRKDASGTSRLQIAGLAFLVFAVSFGIRLSNLDQQPITDELYHLLAADSWVEDGQLAIADGEYRRASVFTRLVGTVLMTGDGSVKSVRVVGSFIGALLVTAVFLWAARTCGLAAGLAASGLLAIVPGAIFLSQHIRFYMLHALVFFVVAWIAYEALVGESTARKKMLASIVIVVLGVLGLHLQITTLIGLAGVALWAILFRWDSIVRHLPAGSKGMLLAGGVVIVTAVIAFLGRDFFASLIGIYQSSAMWNTGDSPLYYHRLYSEQLGILWGVFPAAALVALVARPVPVGLCVCIFSVAFVAQSFGGMRAERFMFYAMPFMLITLGVAFDVVARTLYRMVRSGLENVALLRVRSGVRSVVAGGLVLFAVLFAFVTTPAVESGVRMVAGRPSDPPLYWERYRIDWHGAAPELAALAAQADVTLGSQPLQAIYYLGDVDVALNATMLADARGLGAENGLDPRTGRRVIADADSMAQILACNESGIIVVHRPAWRNRTRVPGAVADLIEANTTPNPIFEQDGLLVFQWFASPDGLNCTTR